VLALAIEYLTGRAVGSAFDDRDSPEWPPHPARLFSALVAAWAEGGRAPAEREALEWLERQGPPHLSAGDADRRTVHTSYVPVNDDARLPERRSRQPRTFPSVIPREPAVVYVAWLDAELKVSQWTALVGLLERVSYLGHSSSLVNVRIADDPVSASYLPVADEAGHVILRVPIPGQLLALEHAHELYERTGIRGQLPCGFQAYLHVDELQEKPVEGRGVFAEMIIFRRRGGPRLPIEAAELVASTLRKAAMDACDDPVPEVLSGHRQDGAKSERPHVAFVALPDVGHRHGDGHLLGAAAILPVGLNGDERRAVLRALGRIQRLSMGGAGAWIVERAAAGAPQRGLRDWTWTRPARRWASVTPVELDNFPDEPYGEEAESIIAESCRRIGLPHPENMLVAPDSIVVGAPPWHSFARSRQPSKRPRRPLVHVVVAFPAPVRGPILLGAGRYQGLGLCRPVLVGGQA
jgi:CRISPR-associated protein Csb2